jgi:hypothetical protein
MHKYLPFNVLRKIDPLSPTGQSRLIKANQGSRKLAAMPCLGGKRDYAISLTAAF